MTQDDKRELIATEVMGLSCSCTASCYGGCPVHDNGGVSDGLPHYYTDWNLLNAAWSKFVRGFPGSVVWFSKNDGKHGAWVWGQETTIRDTKEEAMIDCIVSVTLLLNKTKQPQGEGGGDK